MKPTNNNRYRVTLDDTSLAAINAFAQEQKIPAATALKIMLSRGLNVDLSIAAIRLEAKIARQALADQHREQMNEIQSVLNQAILSVADQAGRNEHFRASMTRALEQLAGRINPLINILEDRMNIPRDSTNSVPARTASADPYFNPDYPDWTPDNCPPPGDRRHYLWKTENVRRQKLANANK